MKVKITQFPDGFCLKLMKPKCPKSSPHDCELPPLLTLPRLPIARVFAVARDIWLPFPFGNEINLAVNVLG